MLWVQEGWGLIEMARRELKMGGKRFVLVERG